LKLKPNFFALVVKFQKSVLDMKSKLDYHGKLKFQSNEVEVTKEKKKKKKKKIEAEKQ
jgi:hypothetical protein